MVGFEILKFYVKMKYFSGEQPSQEFTAASGKALVHFFSDLAINLNGFNVSYESNR